MNEIAIAIKCIWTAWFFVCLSVCYSCILILYFVYDFDNNNNNINVIYTPHVTGNREMVDEM